MEILIRKKYGRVEPGTLLNGRREFYNKLLRDGYCWGIDSVKKSIKVFNTQRPRPNQTIGQFCHEWLQAQNVTITTNKQTTFKPKPTKKPTATAKKQETKKT